MEFLCGLRKVKFFADLRQRKTCQSIVTMSDTPLAIFHQHDSATWECVRRISQSPFQLFWLLVPFQGQDINDFGPNYHVSGVSPIKLVREAYWFPFSIGKWNPVIGTGKWSGGFSHEGHAKLLPGQDHPRSAFRGKQAGWF